MHDLVLATPASKLTVASAIDSMKTGGGTNLSAGIFEGITQQKRSHIDISNPAQQQDLSNAEPQSAGAAVARSISSVLCFTDGQATCGIRDDSTLLTALNNLLHENAHAQLKVHTFGFGSHHSSTLLQGISDAGSGTYYYIAGEENISEAFADALGGLLSVFAQNVQLRFKPRPDSDRFNH